MAIFEHFLKLFCNLFFLFKILKRLFFRLFDPFSTTKRLKTDSRFDYLTVLKTTKAPVASCIPFSIKSQIPDLGSGSHLDFFEIKFQIPIFLRTSYLHNFQTHTKNSECKAELRPFLMALTDLDLKPGIVYYLHLPQTK